MWLVCAPVVNWKVPIQGKWECECLYEARGTHRICWFEYSPSVFGCCKYEPTHIANVDPGVRDQYVAYGCRTERSNTYNIMDEIYSCSSDKLLNSQYCFAPDTPKSFVIASFNMDKFQLNTFVPLMLTRFICNYKLIFKDIQIYCDSIRDTMSNLWLMQDFEHDMMIYELRILKCLVLVRSLIAHYVLMTGLGAGLNSRFKPLPLIFWICTAFERSATAISPRNNKLNIYFILIS